VSLDLPTFKPRFPWWGADLQTLANRLRPPGACLAPHASEPLSFALRDGTGDTLLAVLDRPAEPKPGRPLAIVIHGLTGNQDSAYILSMARQLLDGGHRVLRLNLRGAGPSRATCGGHYYAGRSQDFRALLELLPAELTRDGLVAVGYSLGAAMLLKYLGEEGGAHAAFRRGQRLGADRSCRGLQLHDEAAQCFLSPLPAGTDEARGDRRGRRAIAH